MTSASADPVDLYRAGLKGACDLMKTALENAERLQNQQLMAIRGALEAHSQSVAELGRARTMDELLALQARMANAQAERALRYWTELYQTQMAALGQAQQWFGEVTAQTQENARVADAVLRAAASGLRESSAAR